MSTGHQKNLPKLPGGYQYVREISSGNYGIVWLVHNENIKRDEAIKILFRSGETEYHRFKREIETIATLKHPNIVTVYYAKPEDLYFIMEYLPFSFNMWLKQKDFHSFEGIKLLYNIAKGLHFAHEKGLIHRDLKPGNVLFSEENIPKITDFGLVKNTNLQDAGKDDLTGSVSLGTPRYMSPEQWEGSKIIDKRTDIWALGVMLYEVIAKENPFSNLSGFQLANAVIRKPITPPSKMHAHLNIWEKMAEPVCMKALSRDLNKRYQTAYELAKDLEKIFDIDDETIDLSTNERPKPISLLDTSIRIKKRHIPLYVLILLFVIILLSIGMFSFYQKWTIQGQEATLLNSDLKSLKENFSKTENDYQQKIAFLQQEKKELVENKLNYLNIEKSAAQNYLELETKYKDQILLLQKEIKELNSQKNILIREKEAEKEIEKAKTTRTQDLLNNLQKTFDNEKNDKDILQKKLEKYINLYENAIANRAQNEKEEEWKRKNEELEKELERLITFENSLYNITLIGKGEQIQKVYVFLQGKGFYMRNPIKVSKKENTCIFFSKKNPPEPELQNKIEYIVNTMRKQLNIFLEVRILKSDDRNDEIKIELKE